MEDLQTFIEKRRKERGLTQVAQCKRLDITRSKYNRDVLGGKMEVPLLISIGKVLDFKFVVLPDECSIMVIN